MPQYQPHQRFSDTEREKVAARLKEAYADGRIDHIEFANRLDELYRVQTYGELEPLVSDLPAAQTYKTPEVAKQTPQVAPGEFAEKPARREGGGTGLGATAFAGFGGIVLLNVLIWGVIGVATGSFPAFWPIWLLIPWAVIGVKALNERNARGQLGRDRRRELGS